MGAPETGPGTDGADGFGMTDLEEALRGPDGAAVCQGVTARLAALRGDVAAAIRAGAPPDAYAALEKISAALAAASGLMVSIRDNSR
jgi:hypothetical protein